LRVDLLIYLGTITLVIANPFEQLATINIGIGWLLAGVAELTGTVRDNRHGPGCRSVLI
jgi:hypothetical protein